MTLLLSDHSESALAMPVDVTPQLKVSERYYDNQFTNSPNETDYVSSISPSFKMNLFKPSFKLEANYSLESLYYSKRSDQNDLNQQGSLTLEKIAPIWSSQVKGSILSTNWPEAMVLGNDGILVRGSRFLQEKGEFLWKYEVMRGIPLSVQYNYTWNEYNNASANNSEIHSVGSNLSLPLNINNRLNLTGDANLFRYPSSDVRYKSGNLKSSWIYLYDQFTTLQAGAGVGVASGNFKLLLLDASITRNDGRKNLALEYSRFLSAGGGITTSPLVTQQGTLNLSRTIRENISASLSSSIGESYGYQTGMDFRVRFWNGNLSMTIPVLSWVDASLAFSYYDQNVEGTGTGHSQSSQVLLTLSSRLSAWRVLE